MFDEFDAARPSLVGRVPGPAAPPRVDVAAHLVERLARVLRPQGRRRLERVGLADGPQARDEALARLRGVGGGVDLELPLQIGNRALQIREAPGVARAERFRKLKAQYQGTVLRLAESS